METEDRRIKRTQRLLMDALLTLSLEKGYDTLTIKEITDRADVAYSTFFRHYVDKDALLMAMVGESFETLARLIHQLPGRMPEEEGMLLFQHVQDHEPLYQVIFSGCGVNPVLQQIQVEIQKEIMNTYQELSASAIPLDIAANHVVIAILGLIKWWLEHGKPHPVERMGQIYSELIIRATERALQPVTR